MIFSLFLKPTYINIFPIYAISNTHDVSWSSRSVSNRSNTKISDVMKDEEYKNFRAKFLVFWALWNSLAGYGLDALSKGQKLEALFYIGIGASIAVFSKIILSLIYSVIESYRKKVVKKWIKNKRIYSNIFDDVKNQQNEQNGQSNLNILHCFNELSYWLINICDVWLTLSSL